MCDILLNGFCKVIFMLMVNTTGAFHALYIDRTICAAITDSVQVGIYVMCV